MQLVLSRWGMSLSVTGEMFVVRHEEREHAFAMDRVKSIVLFPGTKVTSDALLHAIERKIEVHFMNKYGHPQGMVWSHYYGSRSDLRIAQAKFVGSKEALEWVQQLVVMRMEGMQSVLQSLRRHRPKYEEQLAMCEREIEKYKERVGAMEVEDSKRFKERLRGYEGTSARVYFGMLGLVLPEQYRFTKREHPRAKDPFNGALNYLYGILYSKIEGEMVKSGIDPYMGVYHRNQFNMPVLVFDMIEPFRAWAEACMMQLCLSEFLEEGMFHRQYDGALYVNTLGKKLIIPMFNEYLNDEVIQWQGRRATRRGHITLFMQQFVQMLRKDFAT